MQLAGATGSDLRVLGGTTTVFDGATFAMDPGSTLRIISGDLVIDEDASVVFPSLTLEGGRLLLGQNGTVDIDSDFTWSGGTLFGANPDVSGTLHTRSGSVTNVTVGGIKTLDGVAFRANGATNVDGDLGLLRGALLQQGTGSVITLGAVALGGAGAGALVLGDTSTLAVRAGATANLNVLLVANNGTTLAIGTGALVLNGGGSVVPGATLTQVGGTLAFNNGVFDWDVGSALTGTGSRFVNGGALFRAVGGGVRLEGLTLQGGVLDGFGNGFLLDQLLWNNGTIAGVGTHVATNLTIATGGTHRLQEGVLVVRGGTWQSGNVALTNGGALRLQGATPFVVSAGSATLTDEQIGAPGAFNVAADALLQVTGQLFVAAPTFIDGAIDARGDLTLAFSGLINGTITANGGLVSLAAPLFLLGDGARFTSQTSGFDQSGGTNVTIGAGRTATIDGPGAGYRLHGRLTVDGTLISAGSGVLLDDNALVTGAGVVDARGLGVIGTGAGALIDSALSVGLNNLAVAGNGVLHVQGLLTPRGTVAFGGTVDVRSGGRLDIDAAFAPFVSLGTLSNAGLVRLTSSAGSGAASLSVAGPFINNGQLQVTAGAAAGARTVSGALVNNGQVLIDGTGATFDGSGGIITSNGRIDLANGAALAVTNLADFVVNGALNLGGGASFTQAVGDTTWLSGAIVGNAGERVSLNRLVGAGAGPLIARDVTLDVARASIGASVNVQLLRAPATIGQLFIARTGTMQVTGGRLQAALDIFGDLVSDNDVMVADSARIAGRLQVGGNLDVVNTLFIDGGRVTANAITAPTLRMAGFIDTGCDTVANPGCDQVFARLTTAGLSVGGLFSLDMAGAQVTGLGTLDDVTIDGRSDLRFSAPGTITSTINGALQLDGALLVGANQRLNIVGGGSQTGSLTAAAGGDVRLASAFNLGNGATLAGPGAITVTALGVTGTGAGATIAAGAQVRFLAVPVAGSGVLSVAGNAFVDGITTFAGTLNVLAGGVVEVAGVTSTDVSLAALNNAGRVELGNATLPAGDATLHVAALVNTGEIVALDGVGARVLEAAFNNLGEVRTEGSTLQLSTALPLTNAGTYRGLNGGDFVLANAPVFDHSGVLTLSAGSVFSLPAGNFIWRAGTVDGGSVDAQQFTQLTNGTLGSTLLAQMLNVAAGNTITITLANVGNAVNNGTLNVAGTLTSTGGVTNNGTLQGNGVINGALLNQGTLAVTGGLTVNAAGGIVENRGGITVAPGISLAVIDAGNFVNVGGITLGSGATFSQNIGAFDWQSGALAGGNFNVAGAVAVTLGGTHNLTGALVAGGIVVGSGQTLAVGGGGSIRTGGLDVQGVLASAASPIDAMGDVDVTGTATLQQLRAGGALRVVGGQFAAQDLTAASLLVDAGANFLTQTAAVSGSVAVRNAGVANVVNQFTVTGALDTASGGALDLGPTANVGGGVRVGSNSQLSLHETLLTTPVVNIDGTLRGQGNVVGNIVNNGTVDIGFSPAVLRVTGNYVQGASGNLRIEIGGPPPFRAGINYDQLLVTGTAQFDGTLTLVELTGFTSFTGGSLLPITYQSFTGAFARTVISGSAGFQPRLNFGPVGATEGALTPPGSPAENTGNVSQAVVELSNQQDQLQACDKDAKKPLDTQVTGQHGVGCAGI